MLKKIKARLEALKKELFIRWIVLRVELHLHVRYLRTRFKQFRGAKKSAG